MPKTISALKNTVMFTIVTAGYVPFALNLEASLQRVGLGNQLLVYTPDRSVERDLLARGVRCKRLGHQRVAEWSDYATPGFAAIAAYKYMAGSEILSSGSNALFIDSDIVFLANPVEFITNTLEQSSADLIMQFESPKNVYNTGFWYARPTAIVLQVFRYIQQSLLVDKTFVCDQQCFNDIVRSGSQIRLHALDPELFACGNQFLEIDLPAGERVDRSSAPFPFESAYLLHFNYLVGKKQKVDAIEKHDSIFYPEFLNDFNEKPSLRTVVGALRAKLSSIRNRWHGRRNVSMR